MHCAGTTYQMKPGEVWVLNQRGLRTPVWNTHAVLSRTHMICDFLPSPALLDLLSRGGGINGAQRAGRERHFSGAGGSSPGRGKTLRSVHRDVGAPLAVGDRYSPGSRAYTS